MHPIAKRRNLPDRTTRPERLIDLARNQADALLRLQDEYLGALEDSGKVWLTRTKEEVELWSSLAARLSTSTTVPEIFNVSRDCFARRLQMAANDTRTILEEWQQLASTLAGPFGRTPAHNPPHDKHHSDESAPS